MIQTHTIRADVRYTRKALLAKIYELNKLKRRYTVLQIALEMDCGEATVYRHLSALESTGYIKKELRGNGESRNGYVLTDEGLRLVQ